MARHYFLLLSWCLLFNACAAVRGGSALIRPIDEKGLQELLRQSQGKVVLLNFWATWCDPCVEEFPNLTKIAREFRPRGVEVILVAIEEPEEITRKVKPFLQAQGVTFPTYYKKTRDDEIFINTLDRNWRGAIPATFIYDANGLLAKKFIAAQSFETFAAALRPLLQK
jgi:thiol-disulfide isomerase/thioredoxin